MRDSAEPFARLMEGCLNRRHLTETYDWLRCFRLCNGPKAHTQVADVIRRQLGLRVRVDPERTFFPMMTQWQCALEEFVRAEDRLVGRYVAETAAVAGAVRPWGERSVLSPRADVDRLVSAVEGRGVGVGLLRVAGPHAFWQSLPAVASLADVPVRDGITVRSRA